MRVGANRKWYHRVKTHLWSSVFSSHDLQEGHDVGRAEEMGADDPVGCRCSLADQIQVDGARVGCQDAIWPTRSLQICKDRLLQVDFFDRCLNHHVDSPEVVVRHGASDSRLGSVCGSPRHRFLLDTGVQVGGDAGEARINKLLGDVLEKHVYSCAGEGGADARAHEAAAQHCHHLHRPCLQALVGHPFYLHVPRMHVGFGTL
jgi:hypothetical protein